jgi:CHASE1-domain containing sensor protein
MADKSKRDRPNAADPLKLVQNTIGRQIAGFGLLIFFPFLTVI